MHDIQEFFNHLFKPDSWPARWHCGRWTSFHGWLYIISSFLIAAAYFSIPLILFTFIKKAKNNLPFQRVFLLFIFFILACGLTHVADALMFWVPVYRISAILLFITALISWAAVFGSYKVLPNALQLTSPARLKEIITQRTAQLAQTNKYLKETNEKLRTAQKRSQLVMRQKDDFISIAGHELKTPVTSLKMYAYLLENNEGLSIHENRSMVGNMNLQINKLTVLINEMLDSSKLQEGPITYQMEYFNFGELIRNVVAQQQITSQFHKIYIEENADPLIYADKKRIGQVVHSLITNAIKYSKEADRINIRINKENDNVICSVEDFGMGIPQDQQHKIFERFYRVSGENMHTYPGMGLGLYIVKDIIDSHNGDIWVNSKTGKGSVFYFKIPIKSS